MNHVVTLLGDPQRALLTSSHVESLRAALLLVGIEPGDPDWLAEGIACDLPFAMAGDLPEALEARLRRALGDAPLDLAVQPQAGRRKSLLVADLESTIIQQEMLDELGELVGKRAEIAEVTERSMRGELNFEAALTQRVALLAGISDAQLIDTAGRMTLMRGAATLVATLREQGVYCALVSGGFTCFAEPIAERLGFHLARANRLQSARGRLTGTVASPILGRDAKRAILFELCEKLQITPTGAAAIGDGANDLAMLQAAGLGVAFRGKPLVRRQAPFRLDHADLTGLLFLQGYRAADLVAA